MNKSYTIIQCSNYFEYMNFKDNFKSNLNVPSFIIEYNDSTYTVKLYTLNSLFFKHAPTATITQVSFRNGRAIYTKLKD